MEWDNFIKFIENINNYNLDIIYHKDNKIHHHIYDNIHHTKYLISNYFDKYYENYVIYLYDEEINNNETEKHILFINKCPNRNCKEIHILPYKWYKSQYRLLYPM